MARLVRCATDVFMSGRQWFMLSDRFDLIDAEELLVTLVNR